VSLVFSGRGGRGIPFVGQIRVPRRYRLRPRFIAWRPVVFDATRFAVQVPPYGLTSLHEPHPFVSARVARLSRARFIQLTLQIMHTFLRSSAQIEDLFPYGRIFDEYTR